MFTPVGMTQYSQIRMQYQGNMLMAILKWWQNKIVVVHTHFKHEQSCHCMNRCCDAIIGETDSSYVICEWHDWSTAVQQKWSCQSMIGVNTCHSKNQYYQVVML